MDACLWLDVNSGMNRTGIAPGDEAVRLYRLIHETQGLSVGGLHVYDGHIHASDVAARTSQCDGEYRAGRGDDRRRSGKPACPSLPWWRAVRRRFPFMRSGPAWN